VIVIIVSDKAALRQFFFNYIPTHRGFYNIGAVGRGIASPIDGNLFFYFIGGYYGFVVIFLCFNVFLFAGYAAFVERFGIVELFFGNGNIGACGGEVGIITGHIGAFYNGQGLTFCYFIAQRYVYLYYLPAAERENAHY